MKYRKYADRERERAVNLLFYQAYLSHIFGITPVFDPENNTLFSGSKETIVNGKILKIIPAMNLSLSTRSRWLAVHSPNYKYSYVAIRFMILSQ